MTSEPQCDAKHVIQAIGALGETAVEGVTTIVEAAVGNYPKWCGDTVFEDSMVGDVLVGAHIRINFFFA